MSKEKQIDEMALSICKSRMVADEDDVCRKCNYHENCLYEDIACGLYKAGYRKQSKGEWHYNPDGMDWGLGAWECSVCGCKNDNLPMDKNINPLRWAGSKYCPNCGAKMKGGAEQ